MKYYYAVFKSLKFVLGQRRIFRDTIPCAALCIQSFFLSIIKITHRAPSKSFFFKVHLRLSPIRSLVFILHLQRLYYAS